MKRPSFPHTWLVLSFGGVLPKHPERTLVVTDRSSLSLTFCGVGRQELCLPKVCATMPAFPM